MIEGERKLTGKEALEWAAEHPEYDLGVRQNNWCFTSGPFYHCCTRAKWHIGPHVSVHGKGYIGPKNSNPTISTWFGQADD